jgi:hypothetical protein
MNRDDVDKLTLGKSTIEDPLTKKPRHIPVIGLPSHLEAEIDGTDQFLYRYQLTRGKDVYTQKQGLRTPEAALQALKSLLNWDPV